MNVDETSVAPVGEAACSDQQSWQIEKSKLEQLQFNLNQELCDAKERVRELSTINSQINEELLRQNLDIAEATKKRRNLETARNELSDKAIELENKVARLKIEKEERDNMISNFNREKQSMLVEMFAFKDQIKQLSEEKSSLNYQIEQFQQEKRSITFEREKYSTESQLYAESKKWFIQEISERDNKISNLRFELTAKDMEMTNEKLQLESELSSLKLRVGDLTEKLDLSKTNIENLLKQIEETEKSNCAQVANLEAELRCQSELNVILKNSMEEAKNAADKFKERLEAKESVEKEVESVLKEAHDEINRNKEIFEAELQEKDAEIMKLKSELLNVSEMMKSKHAVNVTEDELSVLSPVAAETSRLLRGSHNLSSIVRDHARVCGELAAAKEENSKLVSTLQELVDDINEHGTSFAAQRNITDTIFDKSEKLEKQMEDAESEIKRLLNERDSAQRELAFTQAELEKYQRDYELIMKRNAQLMFAAERLNSASDEDWDESNDEKLFTTIVSLQQRNVQLESDIEREKKSAAQAAMNAQNAEMVELKTELAKAREGEARFKSQTEQLKSALNVVKEQAENFKELVRDSVSASEARTARIRAEEAIASKIAMEMNVKRLEDLIEVMKDEREKREQHLMQRLEAAESCANNSKETTVTLQVMLETQKANTAELQQAISSYEKETAAAKKEVEKLLAEDAKKSQKLVELGRQLMDSNELFGSSRVKIRSLEDELSSSKSEVHHLKMENETQRNIISREKQLMDSINEMSTRLARVESEKMSTANTQLEVLQLERDSLKASSARLADQLTHSKNEAKLVQTKLENELECARNKLIEQEKDFAACERELTELRSKLASVQAQFISSDSVGMTPDRLKKEHQQLKNRTQFLENQLDELKRKLGEAETEKAKRDDENAIVENHSNVLEENLKQAEKMGAFERERLEAKAKSQETRAQELCDQLAKLREEYENIKELYDNSRLEAERNATDLLRQLEVVKGQLNETISEKENATVFVNKAKFDVEQKENEIRGLNNTIGELNEKRASFDAQIERLQSQLDDKTMALMAENEAKRQADEMRVNAETALQRKIEERNSIEKESKAKLEEYQLKLEMLSQQYESIASSVSNTSADEGTLGDSSLDSSVLKSDSSSNILNGMQNLLQFIRKEKDNAISRAMNAEIEMRRLRAETAEYEAGRNSLLTRIRELETEINSNAAALVERAKLIEKVESLTNVQLLNSKLTNEKLQLSTNLSKLQEMKRESDKMNEQLKSQLNEMNLKMTTVNQELDHKRKEVAMLKQRCETAGRGQVASIQTQLEQAKARILQYKGEATMAAEQLKALEEAKIKAETNAKQFHTKFEQTRRLALKYRDDYNQLKDSGTCSPATDPSATGNSSELVAKNEVLKTDNEGLKKEIESLKKQVTESGMNMIRMNMLETRITKITEKLKEVEKERDELKQTNMKLTHEKEVSRATSATDVESKSATPSETVNPLRQTPASSIRFGNAGTTATPSTFSPSNVPVLASSTPREPVESIKDNVTGVIPPAPVQTSSAAQENRQVPPSIPNELEDIPPVPSEAVPDPTPPSATFGAPSSLLPVPPSFQQTARVPTQSLFSSNSESGSVTETKMKSTLPNIEPNPAGNVTYSFATSTHIAHGQQLFGKSSAPEFNISTASSDTMAMPEESVSEAAGQSSHVSGSIDGANKAAESDLGTNDGESRDSSAVGGVSSSDVRRKRAADNLGITDAKRTRESPNEAVTSSESRQQRNNAEVPELDEDVVLEMEQEVSDEDPNETVRQREVVGLGNDEEVLEDEMEGEEEDDDDESYGNDEEYDEEDRDGNDMARERSGEDDEDDGIIVLESDENENDDEEDDDADTLNDLEGENEVDEIEEIENDSNASPDDVIEVIGGEDSQPSLDDQDREAASAVEEAEDEGRDPLAPVDESAAPADPTGAAGIGSSGGAQAGIPRVRMPSGMRMAADRDDQCSSSNETSEGTSVTRNLSARNQARLNRPSRGGKPARGIYQPRGRRGGPGGAGGPSNTL